jgi:hypothetical protein
VIKAQEFDRVVEKLGFKTRDGKDLLAWFEYDGRVVARTRRSKGSGDLPFQHSIRQQMKLDVDQLRQAIGCSLGQREYIEILRAKGLI